MATLEDVLLARAYKDSQSRPSYGQAAGIGASIGGLAGLAAPLGVRGRMAGGLVGSILGGGLGMGTRAMMTETSQAGRLLAKLQMGTLTDVDKYALENLLANSYSNPGSLV